MFKEDEKAPLIEYQTLKTFVHPLSIQDKRNFLDWFEPLLNLFGWESVKITQRDMRVFYELSEQSSMDFNPNNTLHVTHLENLYKLYSKSSTPATINVLDDKLWEDLGFQTSKPHTDFRGGGLLALQALTYLTRKDGKSVQEMVEYNKTHQTFLLACAVIAGVFTLKSFFHFGLYSSYKKSRDKHKTCTLRELKEFLLAVDKDPDTFFELVSAWVRLLFFFWKQECSSNQHLTIVDFKTAEDIVSKHFKEEFAKFIDQSGHGKLSASLFSHYIGRSTIPKSVVAYLDRKK